MKPKTEAAVPATAPSGSIDSEFMLDAAQPNDELDDHQQREEHPERDGPSEAEDQQDGGARDVDAGSPCG